MKKTGAFFRKLFVFLFSLFVAVLCAAPASAAFSPLQIGINGDNLQLVSEYTPVIGLRLNLPLSNNDTVAGLDVGLASYARSFTGLRLNAISFTEITINGVELSLCTLARGNLNGIQVSGIGIVAHDMVGLQAGVATYAGTLRGLQLSLWSNADDLRGLQIGLANFSESTHGLQLGIFNSSRASDETGGTVHGLQIGLVNRAKTLHGIQLGLLNIASDSPFPFLPLLRASF